MVRTIEFDVSGSPQSCDLAAVYNAGYTGRDQSVVQAHIDELAEQGISGPAEVPTLFSVPTYMVLQETDVEVEHAKTSGEAEWAMLYRGEDLSPLLTVASDHTDRAVEAFSVTSSKQLSPNLLGTRAWPLDEITEQLDDIALRSTVLVNGEWVLLQEGTVGDLISPLDWLDRLRDLNRLAPGTLLLGGTLPMRDPAKQFADAWSVELVLPTGESIGVEYKVNKLIPSIA